MVREWPTVRRGVETVQKRADESANVMVVAQYLARKNLQRKKIPYNLKFPVVAEFEDGIR